MSFLGFKSLIATVYPALGYLGVFLIIVLLIAWFRGHSRIEDEAERRDRISELVERRDNPKKRFTSKQRRQLRHLVRASNIENAELREAVRKELDEESDDDSHDASSDEKPSGDGDHLHRAIHPSLRLKRMVRSPAVNRVITPVGVRESCQRRRRIR